MELCERVSINFFNADGALLYKDKKGNRSCRKQIGSIVSESAIARRKVCWALFFHVFTCIYAKILIGRFVVPEVLNVKFFVK